MWERMFSMLNTIYCGTRHIYIHKLIIRSLIISEVEGNELV